MPAFYPSAMVRLQIRLDEGTDTEPMEQALERPVEGAAAQDVVPTTETGRQAALAEVEGSLRALAKQRGRLSPEQYQARRARLEAQRSKLQRAQAGEREAQLPASIQAADPVRSVVVGNIQPLEATIERNGYRQADTFSLTLDFRDAPFDSRAIRACGVEIVLGTVNPSEFALGAQGASVGGQLLSQVARAEGDAVLGHTKFFGWMDDWTVSLDPEDGDTIEITGRDMTSLLIDRSLPHGTSIDYQRPIAEGVQELVDQFPEMEGMSVRYRDVRGEDQGPGPVPDRFRSSVLKARRGKRSRNVRSSGRGNSVWDHITEVCLGLGLVPLVVGLDLLLTRPATTFEARSPKLMVYGRNTVDLELTRKFGSVRTPIVEVRSYDPAIGKTRWARAARDKGADQSGVYPDSPPHPKRPNHVQPSGKSTENVFVQELPGITDAGQLQEAARNLFEEIGRHESEGSLTTHDITSWGGEPGDLLDLQHGDAITIETANPGRSPYEGVDLTTTSYQELRQMSVARRADYLFGLGWSREFAQKMAQAEQAIAEEQNTFFVDQVQLDWSRDTGIDIGVQFKNFYVARENRGVEAQERAPGEAARRLAGGREDAVSEDLRRASAENRTLSAEAERGNVSPTEFSERGGELDERQRLAVRQRRGG